MGIKSYATNLMLKTKATTMKQLSCKKNVKPYLLFLIGSRLTICPDQPLKLEKTANIQIKYTQA